MAAEYPMHWSDEAYDYGVAAVLAAMEASTHHGPS
jgi:hypothetical protein